jgi:hypothetical protein
LASWVCIADDFIQIPRLSAPADCRDAVAAVPIMAMMIIASKS